jgi:hypothetical protein
MAVDSVQAIDQYQLLPKDSKYASKHQQRSGHIIIP